MPERIVSSYHVFSTFYPDIMRKRTMVKEGKRREDSKIDEVVKELDLSS